MLRSFDLNPLGSSLGMEDHITNRQLINGIWYQLEEPNGQLYDCHAAWASVFNILKR